MTVRLPVVGADYDQWGNLINTFLEVSHNADGTLQTVQIASGGTGAITAAAALTNLGAATDTAVVHLASTETITGNKNFTGSVTQGGANLSTVNAAVGMALIFGT